MRCCSLPPGAKAINLLPDGPLALAPNNLNNDQQDCGSQVLRGTFDGFALPQATQQLSLLLAATAASCEGTGSQAGVLLGLEGMDLALDCSRLSSRMT